ncbi:MAG: LysR substrate-binding domain-containing protein, partial [Acetatifactor sp.]
QPKIAFEALNDPIVLGVVSANLGVALVAEAVDLTGCHVKALEIENEIPSRDIHMAWVKDRYMTPAVKSFRDFIIQNGMFLDQYKNKKR